MRLNKVLREFNISLDRAIEYLAIRGHVIDARPTTKIDTEIYEILKKGFENTNHNLGVKTVGKIDLKDLRSNSKEVIKKSTPYNYKEVEIINDYKTIIVTSGNNTSNPEFGFPKLQLVFANNFQTKRLNKEQKIEYFPNSGYINIKSNYERDVYLRFESTEFFKIKYQESRNFLEEYPNSVKYESLDSNTRTVEKLPMVLEFSINEILESNTIFHPYKYHSFVFIKDDNKVYGPIAISQSLSDNEDEDLSQYEYKIQSLPTKTLDLDEEFVNVIHVFNYDEISDDYLVYNLYGKNNLEEFYISNTKELLKNIPSKDFILNESDEEVFTKISSILPNNENLQLGSGSLVNRKRLERYSNLKEKSDKWNDYLQEFIKTKFLVSEEGLKLVERYIENNKQIILDDKISEIKDKVELKKVELNKEVEKLLNDKNGVIEEINILSQEKEAIKLKSEEFQKLEKEILTKRKELGLIDDLNTLENKISELKYNEREYDERISKVLTKINEYKKEKQDIEQELADNSKDLIFKRINEIKPYYDLMNGTPAQNSAFKIEPLITDSNLHIKEEVDLELLIDDFDKFLQSKGRKLKKEEIINFTTLYFQNFLIIFSGLPGIGKTSLSNLISEYFTYKSCIIEIPVSKGWLSRKILLGYNNPINNNYQKDEFGFVNTIINFNSYKPNLPLNILLDEANLSPIEYYWSDFISIYDKSPAERTIKLDCEEYREISVPISLRFIATINNDHTTQKLSPRLIDRAPIITLENNSLKTFEEQPEIPEYEHNGYFAFDSLNSIFNDNNDSLTGKEQEILKSIVKIINDDGLGVFIPVSKRKIDAIVKYCSVTREILFKTTSNQFSHIDYAVSQFILPLIKGQGSQFSEMLNRLKDRLTELNLQRSNKILKLIINKGKDFKVYSFFN